MKPSALNDFQELELKISQLPERQDFGYHHSIINHAIDSIMMKVWIYYPQTDKVLFPFGKVIERRLKSIQNSAHNNQTKYNDLLLVFDNLLNDVKTRLSSDKIQDIKSNSTSKPSEKMFRLLEGQVKSIRSVMQENAFDYRDFAKSEENQDIIFSYKNSPMKFIFSQNASSFDEFIFSYNTFSPSFPIVKIHDKYLIFSDALTHFNKWLIKHLQRYRKEIEGGDPWDNLFNNPEYDFTSDDHFSSSEQTSLIERLDVLEKVLSEQFDLLDNEIERVEKAIQELKSQLDKMSKSFWQSYAKGLLTDVVKDVAADSDKANKMLESIVDIFSQVKESFIKLIG